MGQYWNKFYTGWYSNVSGSSPSSKTSCQPAREYAVGSTSHTVFPDNASYGDPDDPWEA